MPRRRNAFAQTWWGQAWIEALEQIDSFTNRLPRGRTYARRGAVLDIRLDDQTLAAAVQGRRRQPYRIRIALAEYSPEQQEQFDELLAAEPTLGAELELGRVPEELLTLTKAAGLELLPESWDDIRASCSCPDWANPCKHLAAVYYAMAGEVDKNPLLLLQLRGIELATAGEEESERPLRQSFVPWREVRIDAPTPERPAFTLTESHGRARLDLLPQAPVFNPSDSLRRSLLKAYEHTAEAAAGLVVTETELEPERHLKLVYGWTDATAEYHQFYRYPARGDETSESRPFPVLARVRLQRRTIEAVPFPLTDVLDAFLDAPLLARDPAHTREAVFLSEAAAVSLLLAERSMFAPAVTSAPDGSFVIHYQPLFHTTEARELQRYLEAAYPPGLLLEDKRCAVCPPGPAVTEVLQLFLTRLVHRYHGLTLRDSLERTFFGPEVFHVERYSDGQIGRAVRSWLAKAVLPQERLVPVLSIEPETDEAFRLTLSVREKNDYRAEPLPVEQVLAAKEPLFQRDPAVLRRDLVRQLTIAGRHFPPLKQFLPTGGPVTLDSEQTASLLRESAQTLQILGLQFVLPKELVKLAQPQVILQASAGGAVESFFAMGDMLSFDWQVALGEETLDEAEFRRLAASAGGVVRFRGQYVYLDPRETAGILERLQAPPPALTGRAMLQAALTGEAQGQPLVLDGRLKQLLADLLQVDTMALPEGLQAELRPYQEAGFRWAYTRLRYGIGCCLADDMGLGKTVQAIAVVLKRRAEGLAQEPVLVVCPTTLLTNWEREFARFAPDLTTLVYHGQGRRLSVKNVDVVLTSYNLCRQEQERLKRRPWSLLVLDEAQYIKNAATQQAKAVAALKPDAVLALTGTPVENRLRELWSLFQVLLPGYFGSRQEFNRRYALPIEKYNQPEAVKRLQQAVAPFVLRRMKTDRSIIADLPDKVVEAEYCRLNEEQASLYQALVDHSLERISASEGIDRRGLVFQLLTGLKQICNHPVQYAKQGAVHSSGSGKAERLVELLPLFADQQQKVLIFSQYREMVLLLAQMIGQELGWEPLVFHGGVSPRQRSELVETFQTKPEYPVLLISLKAGGTGLNLTAASAVVHYDLWWNPAVENQATDRAYRIGQQQAVVVKRMITAGTFEEKIDQMIQAKQQVAEQILAGESSISEWSNQQLAEFFTLA